MNRSVIKKTLMLSLFLVVSTTYAESGGFGLTGAMDNLLAIVRRNAGSLFALIFLVCCIFNIGKLMGDNRDYKAFFISVGLWLLGITIIGGIFTYLLTLEF